MASLELDTQVDSAFVNGLFETAVTLEWLEKKLQEVLRTSAKFGSHTTTELFGLGQGFLSVMVRLKPHWKDVKVNELPQSFVIKISSSYTLRLANKDINWDEKLQDVKKDELQFNMGEYLTVMESFLKVAHASETSFYNLVNENQLKLKVPKCYYAQHFGSNGENGFLIMEDLGEIAAVKPIYEGLSIDAIQQVLKNLAELHAFSLQHEQWLSNPDLKSTLASVQKLGGDNFRALALGAMTMLKSEHTGIFDPLIDRLLESCRNNFDWTRYDTLHEHLGLLPVLTHGDLWMNNIMWRKAEDGTTTHELVAIVDWQIVHPGCVAEDLIRLLCSSVEPKIRRDHLDDFLHYYHDSLKEKLTKEPPFTVAQLHDAYQRLFRFGVVMILPCFASFVQAELGMLGNENVEKRKQDVLNRAKCFLEDLYDLEDNFGL